ncbi:MAG TPA: hypothetical protein VN428_26460 [Bryobacteraceae bacterium]|nr:hypothetical protein [Bryobacteraceae bacterium]
MPLFDDARTLIRANLEALQRGNRVSLVVVGKLTDAQLEAINRERDAGGYPRIDAEVVFLGQHIFKSRALRDGYALEDIIDQIASAMDAASVARPTRWMTVVENPTPRADRYGNCVRDRIVLECSARYPRPELFSVIPKGDTNKPNKRPLTCGERPDPQRLARVTTASGAPAAADNSIALVPGAVNEVIAPAKG